MGWDYYVSHFTAGKLGFREVNSLAQGHAAELRLKTKAHGLLGWSSFLSQGGYYLRDLEAGTEGVLGARGSLVHPQSFHQAI